MYDSTTVTVGWTCTRDRCGWRWCAPTSCSRSGRCPTTRTRSSGFCVVGRGVRCCYEAGPTGFGLYRHLVGRGIDCSVVAPGLVPQRPGDRIKTDPRDARKLARLLAGGLLEPIHVPSSELEAARDLVRAREDARLDRMRDRQRLSKFCLRHGRLLPTSAWTVTRRKWLSEQRFEVAAQQQPL